jgi:hypothetical protein
MKTSELTGAALNWAVACARWGGGNFGIDGFSPSTDWAQGGPIIEREGIALLPPQLAEMPGYEGRGETLLIAAMRCYVASKLGDEVEILEVTA